MRITMVSIGSMGDVRPVVLLGRELASRGHDITVAVFPQYRNTVEKEGLHFRPLDGDAAKMISAIMQPDTNGLTYLPRLIRNLRSIIPGLLDSMIESCRGADAMVCNFFGSVYYSIAEMFGLPCVQLNLFPVDPTGDMPISAVRNQRLGKTLNMTTYRLGYILMSLIENHYLSSWRKDNSLEARRIRTLPDCRIGTHPVPVIYAISPSLLPRPAEWGDNVHMSGFIVDDCPCDWKPPEALQAFMDNPVPPVYIGFGSMNTGNMNKMITIILRAVRAAGIRAVISLENTGRTFSSGSRIWFADSFIPHDWLFPRVSAVIHHGGVGTTSSGLRYGKPTLVIPFAGDQPFWGSVVWKAGCGPRPIPRESLTVRKMTEGILDLVSTSNYKENALRVSSEILRERGKSAAADIIEQSFRDW